LAKKTSCCGERKEHPLVEYRSDLEDFLGKTMSFLNDPVGVSFCKEFPALFNQAMKTCEARLGAGCFRLPKNGDGPRRPISMALFETIGYIMIESQPTLGENQGLIRSDFQLLLTNQIFIRSTTYVVDSNISVKKRFEFAEEVIRRIRHA